MQVIFINNCSAHDSEVGL